MFHRVSRQQEIFAIKQSIDAMKMPTLKRCFLTKKHCKIKNHCYTLEAKKKVKFGIAYKNKLQQLCARCTREYCHCYVRANTHHNNFKKICQRKRDICYTKCQSRAICRRKCKDDYEECHAKIGNVRKELWNGARTVCDYRFYGSLSA